MNPRAHARAARCGQPWRCRPRTSSCCLGTASAGRVGYPYDLEWMEGGMLHHALRMPSRRGHLRAAVDRVHPVPVHAALSPRSSRRSAASSASRTPLGRVISVISLVAGRARDRRAAAPRTSRTLRPSRPTPTARSRLRLATWLRRARGSGCSPPTYPCHRGAGTTSPVPTPCSCSWSPRRSAVAPAPGPRAARARAATRARRRRCRPPRGRVLLQADRYLLRGARRRRRARVYNWRRRPIYVLTARA